MPSPKDLDTHVNSQLQFLPASSLRDSITHEPVTLNHGTTDQVTDQFTLISADRDVTPYQKAPVLDGFSSLWFLMYGIFAALPLFGFVYSKKDKTKPVLTTNTYHMFKTLRDLRSDVGEQYRNLPKGVQFYIAHLVTLDIAQLAPRRRRQNSNNPINFINTSLRRHLQKPQDELQCSAVEWLAQEYDPDNSHVIMQFIHQLKSWTDLNFKEDDKYPILPYLAKTAIEQWNRMTRQERAAFIDINARFNWYELPADFAFASPERYFEPPNFTLPRRHWTAQDIERIRDAVYPGRHIDIEDEDEDGESTLEFMPDVIPQDDRSTDTQRSILLTAADIMKMWKKFPMTLKNYFGVPGPNGYPETFEQFIWSRRTNRRIEEIARASNNAAAYEQLLSQEWMTERYVAYVKKIVERHPHLVHFPVFLEELVLIMKHNEGKGSTALDNKRGAGRISSSNPQNDSAVLIEGASGMVKMAAQLEKEFGHLPTTEMVTKKLHSGDEYYSAKFRKLGKHQILEHIVIDYIRMKILFGNLSGPASREEVIADALELITIGEQNESDQTSYATRRMSDRYLITYIDSRVFSGLEFSAQFEAFVRGKPDDIQYYSKKLATDEWLKMSLEQKRFFLIRTQEPYASTIDALPPMYLTLFAKIVLPKKIAALEFVWENMPDDLRNAFGTPIYYWQKYPRTFIDFMLTAHDIPDFNKIIEKAWDYLNGRNGPLGGKNGASLGYGGDGNGAGSASFLPSHESAIAYLPGIFNWDSAVSSETSSEGENIGFYVPESAQTMQASHIAYAMEAAFGTYSFMNLPIYNTMQANVPLQYIQHMPYIQTAMGTPAIALMGH